MLEDLQMKCSIEILGWLGGVVEGVSLELLQVRLPHCKFLDRYFPASAKTTYRYKQNCNY